MNDSVYRLGLWLSRWALRVTPLSSALAALSRVWGRQHKVFVHLRTLQFDGVVDGGANVGEFAALVRAALPGADLVCVEPQPAAAGYLRQHRYRVVEAALWHQATRLTLRQPTPASTSCTVLDPGTTPAQGAWEVTAIRLESLEIRGTRILVKLDLQGAELPALEGMGSLWQRTAGVLLETPIGPTEPAVALADLLRSHGFYEYSTTNELFVEGHVIEADKLWLKRDLIVGVPRKN